MTAKSDGCENPLDELIELSEGFLKRLASERKCPLCMTSIYVRERGEKVNNGVHAYCLLANVNGHVVRACRCYPDTDGLSDREVAVLAFTRLKARWG